ncbi:MAG: DNA polymerase III subunit delta [Gammaproteobacteria bacterium]
MKLTADKLKQQLSKGLSPIYFVTGDEPLLVGEVTDVIRSCAREHGYDERESHSADARFDWSSLLGGLDNLSLFASKKIIEVRLVTGKPGREGGAALCDLVANPPADTLFIITAPKLDGSSAKTKWAKTLEQDAVRLDLRSPSPDQLPGWLSDRMRQAGLDCDAEGLEILAARVEGNLMAAQQEINKLQLLVGEGRVTGDMVRRSVADGARFDVFQLADAAVGQDAGRAVRILYGLRKEGVAPALVTWALAREASQLITLWTKVDQGTPPGRAMSEARVWQNRQGLFSRALASHNERSIRELTDRAALTDRVIKGAAPGQPWNALLELIFSMAHPGRMAA